MARLSVCLTFDFDAISLWLGTMRSDNPAEMSRGEFGAYAIPRILTLLKRHDILASFYIPGHTALAYPRLVASIREDGHEIAHHGWVHENLEGADLATERRILELGLDALDKVADVTPVGYRSTGGNFTDRTVELLLEYGLHYDHSCHATDFYPYYLRTGDKRSVDSAYIFGEPSNLIEVPFNWAQDDFPLFEFTSWSSAQKSPAMVREMWQAEFDYAYAECEGGIYDVTMHPQVIGRGSRIAMLDDFIGYMRDHDVAFERVRDYVDRWRLANPVEAWASEHPDLSGSGAWREGETWRSPESK